MATLSYVVNAVDRASATFARIAGSADELNAQLDDIGKKRETAWVGLKGDKEAELAIDKIDFKMARLGQRVAEGKIGVDGQARALLEIQRLELAMDKLNAKRAKVHIDTSALSKLSAFQPSAMGAALALSPALIPLLAQATAGVTALGVSFGAAAAGAGLFGLMASNVLTKASENLKKLQALNMRLNAATTAAQKKAIKQQIDALTAGWSKGYMTLIGQLEDFKTKWQSVSQAITVPALTVWMDVLTKGLQFLKPLVKPVADAFTLWGITLNTYFSDPATVRHIKDMAAAFGNFAAQNLYQIGQFVADIGKGIFNLGKDLAASGANFSAAGTWLARMGDGFLSWSKSDSARRDVRGFMKFLHDEGPVVKGILKDLGKILPGIFAGATTVGTLELQALGDFLHLIAGLPKGWQKGLTEAAGALLLLNKLGVVKVGLKMTGWVAAGQAAGGAAEGAAAGGALGALQRSTGLRWVMRAGVAVAITELIVKPTLQQTSSGKGKNWWDNPFGTDKGKGALNSWKDLWHDIEHLFDTGRHFIAASWDATWQDTIGEVIRSARKVWDLLKGWWHNIADTFDHIRHDIATIWDTIWRNTVTRTRNSINDVIGWFKSLPGRAISALEGLGTMLWNFGHMAFTKFWNGLKSVVGGIVSWLKGFAGGIVQVFKNAWKWFSPSGVMYEAGRDLMLGLFHGIRDHAHKVQQAWGGAINFGGLTGALGGNAAANRRLAMRMFPWPMSMFGAFNALEMSEAGYSLTATNPSSGAYGMAQFINGPGEYYQYGGNPYTAGGQLAGMFNYIRQRFGNPAAAWAFHLQHGWYDAGGWLPPGVSLAVNQTGQPERVVPPGGGDRDLLRSILHELRQLNRQGPSRTGAAVGDAINGTTRRVALGR